MPPTILRLAQFVPTKRGRWPAQCNLNLMSEHTTKLMMRDARSCNRERRCSRLLVRRTLHPAIVRDTQYPAERERSPSNWHLACAAVAWLAEFLHGVTCMAEEEIPVTRNVIIHVWATKCPRQPARLLQHSKPLLRQDPRRASYMRYHSPCFQGRVPAFWSGGWCHAEAGKKKAGKERKRRQPSLHIRIWLTEVARTVRGPRLLMLRIPCRVPFCLATIPSPCSWKFILIVQAGTSPRVTPRVWLLLHARGKSQSTCIMAGLRIGQPITSKTLTICRPLRRIMCMAMSSQSEPQYSSTSAQSTNRKFKLGSWWTLIDDGQNRV